jgi:hypothetical protein
MSSASHCEIERDLGNPYSVELATGFLGYGTKTKPLKADKWVARTGQRAAEKASSGDAASDGHGGWLQEAHASIISQKDAVDKKHTQEQEVIKETQRQAHEDIKKKETLLEHAKVLDAQHRHAMNEHAKVEAVRATALKHHEEQVQGAHARSTAALKAAEDAKNAFLGKSHNNAEASSDTGHDNSDWDDVNNHENMYSKHHAPQIRSREISRELNDAEKKGAFDIGRHQVHHSNTTPMFAPTPPPRARRLFVF